MSLPVLIIGAGGHGRVIADCLRLAGRQVLGYLDAAAGLKGSELGGLRVVGGDDQLKNFDPHAVVLVNGIGSISSTILRRQVYERMAAAGYKFEALRHPTAIVSSTVKWNDGVQLMAGAIVQSNASIGENTIVNTGAIVDHDCRVGAHCHLAPGVVFSGEVQVGDGVHVGTGACVIQGVTIGAGAMIAAGAVVVRNVPGGARVAGVPARSMVTK